MLEPAITTFEEDLDFSNLNEEEQIALLLNAPDIESLAHVNKHFDVVVSEESVRAIEIEHVNVPEVSVQVNTMTIYICFS